MIFIFACAGALALTFLVATEKVHFPLLFDTGLSITALSMVWWAAGVEAGDQTPKGAISLFVVGMGCMLASAIRQKTRQVRANRKGPPQEIDGRHMGAITGGKRS